MEAGMPPDRAWPRSRDTVSLFGLPARTRARVQFRATDAGGGRFQLDGRLSGDATRPWADGPVDGAVTGSTQVSVDATRGFAPDVRYSWEISLNDQQGEAAIRRVETFAVEMHDQLQPAPRAGSGAAP